MKYTFDGVVTEDYKLKLSKRRMLDTVILTFAPGTEVTLTLSKRVKNRSNAQNAYYWAVPVKILAEHLGYEYEEAHEALKWQFLRKGDEVPTVRSTTKLTTEEFNDYIDRIIRWAAIEFRVVIPDPNECEVNDNG